MLWGMCLLGRVGVLLGVRTGCVEGKEWGGDTFVENPLEINTVFELLSCWFILADVFEDYFSKFLPDPGIFGQQPECP